MISNVSAPADRELAELDRNLKLGTDRERREQRARQLLGFSQRRSGPIGNGPLIWVRSSYTVPQLPAGFPSRWVEQVEQAYQVEQAARAELQAAEQRAQQWIDTNHPSEQLARLKWEENTLEAVNKLRPAIEATALRCQELGAALETFEQAMAVINRAPARRQQVETQYQTALSQIDTEVSTARTALQRLS